MVKKLIYHFTYVDAMVVDTPITSVEFASELQDARDIRDRLSPCARFLDYLDSQWSGLANRETIVNWPEVSGALRDEIEDIAARVKITRGRRGSGSS